MLELRYKGEVLSGASSNVPITSNLHMVPIVLYEALWDGKDQTVPVKEVVEDDRLQLITPVPSRDCRVAYYTSDIKLVDQTEGQLTFRAMGEVPAVDCTVYIYMEDLAGEGTSTPSVEEYDTDDGWHVRKYSDGYVEMSYVERYQNVPASPFDSGQMVILRRNTVSMPLQLSSRYFMASYLTKNETMAGMSVTNPFTNYNELSEIPGQLILTTPSTISLENSNYEVCTFVTGRWK